MESINLIRIFILFNIIYEYWVIHCHENPYSGIITVTKKIELKERQNFSERHFLTKPHLLRYLHPVKELLCL